MDFVRSNRLAEILNWCIPAGRISGVAVGIHWSFPLTFVLYSLSARAEGGPRWGYTIAGTILLLYGIVLAHEFGHVFAARREGIGTDRVMLWPLGGLAYLGENSSGPAEVRIAAAGPAVNLGFAILLLPVVALLGFPISPGLFDPFHWGIPLLTDGKISGFGQDLAWCVYKANLIGLYFNLIPAFPMDGGRILRGILHPRMGLVRSTIAVTTVALVAVGGFAIWAVAASNFLLLLIAVFVGYSALATRRQVKAVAEEMGTDGFLGYDFSMGHTSLGNAKEDRAEEKRREKEAARRERERLREREMEEELDRLLEKISREGLPSLTRRERAFLDKASRRKR